LTGNSEILEKILTLLENGEIDDLQKLLEEIHPSDIAEVINALPTDLQLFTFLKLSEEKASETLPNLFEPVRENILDNIQNDHLFKIIDEMESDEATDLLSELENDVSKEILEKLDKEDSESIKILLDFDKDSAGGLMQTEIIAVSEFWKRDQIINYIRENHDEVYNIHNIFVTDDYNRLLGTLEVTRLLLAADVRTARELMDTKVISVNAETDQEEVAKLFRKYSIYSIPVIDSKGILLGRITIDDIIDVIDEEATEDAYKFAGMASQDKVFNNPLNSVGKRLPWLLLNLLTALLVSAVVGIFEDTIARLSFLAVLMPIVAGLGGNSGTQTLTVITRGIALGELTLYNTYKAITKEILVGIINGSVIGFFAMLIAYLLKGDIMLGIVLGSAMIANMFIAGLFGSIIPIIMKTLKFDPALASSVLITMLTDIGGFASFLGLATLLL